MAAGIGIVFDSFSGTAYVNQIHIPGDGSLPYEQANGTPIDMTIQTGSVLTFYPGTDGVLDKGFGVQWDLDGIPAADIEIIGYLDPLDGQFMSSYYFRYHVNTPGTYVIRVTAAVKNDTYYNSSYLTFHVVGAPPGIGINPTGQVAVTEYFTDTATFPGNQHLPKTITVEAYTPLHMQAVGFPGPLSNFNWQLLTGAIPTYSIGPNGQPTMDITFAGIGSGFVDLQANNNGSPYSFGSLNLNVVWGKLNNLTLKFVNSLVEGWESMPFYNSTYSSGKPLVNTTTVKGWSAPLASADQLDYFRRQQVPNVDGTPAWFPDYVGWPNAYDYMGEIWHSTGNLNGSATVPENFGYPAWRRFVLDSRYIGNHTINQPQNWDNADFGWWMNTSNLGWLGSNGTGNPTYKGTTVKGMYDGLNAFYTHVGHSNVVYGMLKRAGTVYGIAPTEYVSNAQTNLTAYKQMVQNLINNDKPFLILVSGNPSQPLSAPNTIANAIVIQSNSIWGSPSARHVDLRVNTAVAGATYKITIYGYTVSYTATGSDTTSSIAAGLYNAVNATTLVQWNSGGSAPSVGTTGFPPIADFLSANILSVQMDTGHQLTPSATGPSFSTNADDIQSSSMNPNCGPEYIRTIGAKSLLTTSPTFLTLNDDSTSILTPIDPIPGVTVDQITGNAYIVIGYCLPTANAYLPDDAKNKFLLICKETGGDRNQNIYFSLDAPLTSTVGDSSLWDRLLGTYTVSPSQTTYVSPRPPLIPNPAGSQIACAGVPILLYPPLLSGAPHDNAYDHIYSGVQTLRRNGFPVTGWEVNPQTFTTPGTYPITYQFTDGVTHLDGAYNVVVNPTQNPVFTVADNFGNSITGTPLTIATGQTYVLTPTSAINPAFTYTWSAVRTDAPSQPGDYVFVQGNANTAGPVKIKFNTAGQYNIILTTSGTFSGTCPGQYALPARVDFVTLDFLYTTPTFFGLPVTFNGQCNVAVSNWDWSFGDGGTGNGQNTVHTYFSIGQETVTLTVTTAYGLMSVTHILSIFPAAAVADFIYSPLTNIVVGETVLFTDLSTPQPTSDGSITATWHWDFGDGNTSTAQNPSHAYGAPGIYNVTLTYTIFFGTPQLSRTDSITKQLTVASGAPVVKSQTFIVSRNLVDNFDLSNYVTSANPLVYTIEQMPPNGDLTLSNPSLVAYQPNLNYIGPDVFTFKATDNFGLFATGNINLIVRPPELQIIVGEIISDAGIITIRLGTAEINTLLLKQVIIKNIGTGKLKISGITIIEDIKNVFRLYNLSQVQVPNFSNLTLDPKDSFAFYVGILAATVGTYTAKLQVEHN